MADYPLKQEAAEVQNILDGAVLSNKSTLLSERDKALARDNIGASAFGMGIQIAAHFDTVAELEATITNPVAGNAYSVGVEVPYDLYAYDFYHSEWRNYGPIRANDIKARFAQNLTVFASAWEEDVYVFADYTWKASVPLGEITGNDFPIVAFAPADAISGNFCPISYAFDDHVEIWAKTKPTTDISIPALTFIIQDTEETETGNSTKGITNASGGVASGGIGTNQLANASVTAEKIASAARTKYFNVTIPADWEGTAAPYYRSVFVEGIKDKDVPKVFFTAPETFAHLEEQQEAFAMLYDVDSAQDTLIFYAKEKPAVQFAVLVEVSRI